MSSELLNQLKQLADGTIEHIDPMKERLYTLAIGYISWHNDSPALRTAVRAVLVDGLTQQDAAEAHGVHQNSISRAIRNIYDVLAELGENKRYVMWEGFVSEDSIPILNHVENKDLEPLEKELAERLAKKAKRKSRKPQKTEK